MSKNHNKFKNIFSEIVRLDNLEQAFNRTQLTDCKFNRSSIKFSLDLLYNLRQLQKTLKQHNYKPKPYKQFEIYEPKRRIIKAPKLQDKIVQFAVHNIINPGFEQKFIKDSYACQDNKGTHNCAKTIKHYLSKANWLWDDVWIIKSDIKKYFYTVDRDILYKLLVREIKCDKTLSVLYKIINSLEGDKGIPLGNITSQLFANIYLNELDNYLKRKLSVNFYCRYLDDFCIIVDSKSKAKSILDKVKIFIVDNLKLKLNKNKTKIFPINQGINMVGYKIHPTHMLLRSKSKKVIKSKLKKFRNLLITKQITKSKVEQIMNSWKGHAEFGCSRNFFKYIVDRFNFVYFDKNGKMSVNLDNIF